MLPNPSGIDKYLYVNKTPTWKVRSLYSFGIISWLLIIYSYLGIIWIDPFYSWFVAPILFLLTIYHLVSFSLNLFYRQFDIRKHNSLVDAFSDTPAVDIFLPVCGEELEVLKNTWEHVSNLYYKNKRVYVLDDSKVEIEEHKQLARQYGFTYFERPNKGEMKKAGNLKYAFERTSGEYIAIFDADFAPHLDFLNETLPHMQDPTVGIVQTPQYFETTPQSYKHSPFAYNAAYAEEPFYRFIQVTRNRFGGSICCGSNAVYRRVALEAIGGPYQIDYSEDAHTGFAITKAGFRVLYIPILLAIGLCPDNYYAFFHQQHRWSMGSMHLMLSKEFWRAKVSWKIKYCYITGFMFYLHHPLIIVFPLQLFWTLFLYNEFIPVGTSLLFYPHIVFAIIYLWLFPIAKLHFGYFELLIARTYAYAHAVKSSLLKKSVGWISTNAKHTKVSKAFQETTSFVIGYVVIYILLILMGLRTGDIHLLDYRYWSVQFWVFYNLMLTALLLRNLIGVMKQIKNKQNNSANITPVPIRP